MCEGGGAMERRRTVFKQDELESWLTMSTIGSRCSKQRNGDNPCHIVASSTKRTVRASVEVKRSEI